jgi:hypothetical protein
LVNGESLGLLLRLHRLLHTRLLIRNLAKLLNPDAKPRRALRIGDLAESNLDISFVQLINRSSPAGAAYHVQPSESVPARLPPLDVSPPSLGFTTVGSSPPATSSSQLRSLSGISGQGMNARTYNNRLLMKGQQRPAISVSAPTSRNDIAIDGNVFVSPRSAPIPPARTADHDSGRTPSDSTARVPTSPLRFPIPPTEGIPTAVSFPEETLLCRDQSEFNSEFSFPGKMSSSVYDLSGGRDDRVSGQDKFSRSKGTSSLRERLVSDSEVVSETYTNHDDRKPPASPLPTPPALSKNSNDEMGKFTSLISNATMSRSVRSPSRSRPVLQMSTSSDSHLRGSSVHDPQQDRVGILKTKKETHERKQSAGALKEQHFLRVEISEQRARFDELASKVTSIISKSELERDEMRRRVDVLETETRDMAQEIKRLTTIVMDGHKLANRSEIGGFLETPASTVEAIDDILMTPSGVESPSSTFERARRPSLTTPKVLRRSNTMPDGFEGLGTVSRPMASGKKSSRSSSPWIMDSSGLLPKFVGGLRTGTTERGLGLDFALVDSPVVKENSINSVPDTQVSSSYSSSVPTLSSSMRSQSRPTIVQSPSAATLTERLLGFRSRSRREKSSPNMEEILAKLRSFESHSPGFR